jgi:hypothetical protein
MAEHSVIGPSALHRLLACPASHRLGKDKERKPSVYAAQGSVAHQIIEGELGTAMIDERPKVGDIITYEGFDIEVDQEMLDGVDQMVAFCEALSQDASREWVEQKVQLAPLWDGEPPEPIFGTVDYAAYVSATDTLYVVDFKYGRLPVHPEDNPQAYAYALGACYELNRFPAHVVIVIVQPRGQDDSAVKVSHITGLDLLMWAKETLKPGVEALFSDTAPFATGDHCRFCPAKINCPALYELAKKTSRTQFTNLPPDPIDFTDEELSEILDNIEVLAGWFEAVRAEASGRLENNKKVPGWKLVPKRAMRKYTDQKVVEQLLDHNSMVWDRKLKSPTQVEKVDPEQYETLVERGLIDKVSSGTTLAPDHDPREAVRGRSGRAVFGKLN